MGAMFIQINLREKILERKFHIAIEAAPTAMLMIDENGRMILVNKQMESLFGYTRKELLKLNVDSLLPEKFRHAHPAHRRHFLQNPEARKMGGGRELFGLKKDGLEIPVEIGLMPVRTPEGEFVIGSIIDISERKAAQTLIEKKNKQLAVVNDELSQFAYRTSHDLKAPLVTMQGLARYIEKDIQTGNLGEALENVRKILFQSERLSGLVTDILDLSKADLEDAGEEAVDFDKLIEEMREKFAILTAGNHVEVVYNNQLSGSFVSQTSRVRQIVENLVSNGIKYCNPKQVQKYVRVHLLEKPEAVVLIVADNGLGVPEQRKGDLFRMFKRFHPNVSFGSGLGMSIVKKHVDRLGGSIQLASSGEGTCVEVCFPRNGKVGEI
jgi:PAS domain S-box-containing protein